MIVLRIDGLPWDAFTVLFRNVRASVSAEEEWLQRQSVGELRTGHKKQRQGGENLTQLSDQNRNVTAFKNILIGSIGEVTDNILRPGTWSPCLKEF